MSCAESIGLLLSLVTAGTTIIYATLTFFILLANNRAVSAMEKQVTAMTRPYVHFDIRFFESVFIEATIVNRGITAAHDIVITCIPELKNYENVVATLPKQTIPLLSPGRELTEFLGSWEEIQKLGQAVPVEVTVTYRDGSDKQFTEKSVVDVGRFVGLLHIGKKNTVSELKRVADALETANKMAKEN